MAGDNRAENATETIQHYSVKCDHLRRVLGDRCTSGVPMVCIHCMTGHASGPWSVEEGKSPPESPPGCEAERGARHAQLRGSEATAVESCFLSGTSTAMLLHGNLGPLWACVSRVQSAGSSGLVEGLLISWKKQQLNRVGRESIPRSTLGAQKARLLRTLRR